MTRDWMELQSEINKGFQAQLDNIVRMLEMQEEINAKLQQRVTELEDITKRLREES